MTSLLCDQVVVIAVVVLGRQYLLLQLLRFQVECTKPAISYSHIADHVNHVARSIQGHGRDKGQCSITATRSSSIIIIIIICGWWFHGPLHAKKRKGRCCCVGVVVVVVVIVVFFFQKSRGRFCGDKEC